MVRTEGTAETVVGNSVGRVAAALLPGLVLGLPVLCATLLPDGLLLPSLLLLLWARGQVAEGSQPSYASTWVAKRLATAEAQAVAEPTHEEHGETVAAAPAALPTSPTLPPLSPLEPSKTRDDRIARMSAGLAELERWLDDRVRTGLADPSLASYKTWDGLAARLIDAQVGGLANRVRRLAGLVGAHPDWHSRVLAELGVLHLLATSGRHLGDLSVSLADSVAATIGWHVRQADVLAGVPETDHWVVMGRSDTREDRIEVRRIWLRGTTSGEWAMLLSFAAFQQSLDTSYVVGTQLHADVFRYPGSVALRVLMGPRHGEPQPAAHIVGSSIAEACNQIGRALAAEPWLERYPLCVVAAPTRSDGRWLLTDSTGSLPLIDGSIGGILLACTAGRPSTVMAEWTVAGLVPLTVHLADRAVDIGPVAEASFVKAAS